MVLAYTPCIDRWAARRVLRQTASLQLSRAQVTSLATKASHCIVLVHRLLPLHTSQKHLLSSSVFLQVMAIFTPRKMPSATPLVIVNWQIATLNSAQTCLLLSPP